MSEWTTYTRATFLNMEVASKKLTEKMARDLLTKRRTTLVKGFKKSNNKGTFDARIILNDDLKLAFEKS